MPRNIQKLERKLSKPDAEKYTTKTNPKHEYKGLIQTRKYLRLNNNSSNAPQARPILSQNHNNTGQQAQKNIGVTALQNRCAVNAKNT